MPDSQNPATHPALKQPGNRINLIGIIVGVVLLLLKSHYAIVGGAIIIFVCAFLLIWNTQFVENYRSRGIFLGFLLAAGCIGLAYAAWPETRLSPTDAKIDEIDKAIKGLGERYRREELLKKYPLGYVVFDLDYKNAVFPYDNQLPKDYRLDWKVVGFTSITRDRYELRLPDIYTKEGQPFMTGVKTGGLKQVGGGQGGASVGGTDIMMWSQVLAITDKGMVFVIGFEHVPGLNSSK